MILSRFGCKVKLLGWKKYKDGTISKEIVNAVRLEDDKRKEYHLNDLRANGGLKEILKALKDK